MRDYRLILLVVLLLSLNSALMADDLSGRTGIGIGFLYISLKHGLNSKISLEGLISPIYYDSIGVGGRLYMNTTPLKKMVWYIGTGVGLFNYYGPHRIYGPGLGLSFFGGGEYFVDKDFTIGGDLGPVFVGIYGFRDTYLDLKFGIHYYFD